MFAEVRLSLEMRIQAEEIYYKTKNALQTSQPLISQCGELWRILSIHEVKFKEAIENAQAHFDTDFCSKICRFLAATVHQKCITESGSRFEHL